MTKDYAKHRPKFIAKRHNRYKTTQTYSTGLPSWAWVLFGLFFGIATSSFLFWKIAPKVATKSAPVAIASLDSTEDLPPKAKSKASAKKNKVAKPSNTALETSELHPIKQASAPESRFDFYTLLPTMSVDPLASETPHASKKSILPYILQAGSFKTQEQADQLKAILALQGIEAHIQTVRINPSESWYRVYIGPFNTKADALGVQQNLENRQILDSDRFNSVILKMRVS